MINSFQKHPNWHIIVFANNRKRFTHKFPGHFVIFGRCHRALSAAGGRGGLFTARGLDGGIVLWRCGRHLTAQQCRLWVRSVDTGFSMSPELRGVTTAVRAAANYATWQRFTSSDVNLPRPWHSLHLLWVLKKGYILTMASDIWQIRNFMS